MQTVIITREDINNPLHPTMFDGLCEQFGLDPKVTDEIELTVAKATDPYATTETKAAA